MLNYTVQYAKKVLLMLNNTDIWRDAADYLVGGGGEKLWCNYRCLGFIPIVRSSFFFLCSFISIMVKNIKTFDTICLTPLPLVLLYILWKRGQYFGGKASNLSSFPVNGYISWWRDPHVNRMPMGPYFDRSWAKSVTFLANWSIVDIKDVPLY